MNVNGSISITIRIYRFATHSLDKLIVGAAGLLRGDASIPMVHPELRQRDPIFRWGSAVDVTRWPTGHCASGIFARDNVHEPAPLPSTCGAARRFRRTKVGVKGWRILKIEPRESRPPTSIVVLERGWAIWRIRKEKTF
jgi:hypothetical protein